MRAPESLEQAMENVALAERHEQDVHSKKLPLSVHLRALASAKESTIAHLTIAASFAQERGK